MSARHASHQRELFADCRKLRGDGRGDEAAQRLREALRRHQLDPAGILQAGQLLQKLNVASNPDNVLRVAILGQCTTSWLVPALTAVAFGRGQSLAVTEADYDNVAQGIDKLEPDTDAVIFVPWSQRLLDAGPRDAEERLRDELGFWQNVWAMAAGHADLHVLQVGYDWVDAGADGHYPGSFGGDFDIVRRLNDSLRERLPAGSYFVDLEQVSGILGRERMYDRRRYFWTRQPFSEAGVVRLAEHLWAGLRAITTGPKKVLVLDLDNTLWGGVVGETGPLGIELGETPAGEAFRDFQRLAKSLAERGILIAVCSKNNPEDAREPFAQNPDMVLSMDDIVAFEASWTPKVDAIRGIAETLRLGLDSFVFFDDEPTEREHVRLALPEVEVVEVPDDPADYRQALLSGLWFESIAISEEDRLRTKQYRVEQNRMESQSALASLDDYLGSLDLRGSIGTIDATTIERVVQLLGKTNQFNLTTRRHTRETVADMLGQQDSIARTLHVQDRFGDYGLVSVIIAVADADSDSSDLRIDTWLMSCRVIGRTAEQFFFNALLEIAKERGISRLIGEHIPTRKNAVVADLYTRLGFSRARPDSAPGELFELNVADAMPAATFVAELNTDK